MMRFLPTLSAILFLSSPALAEVHVVGTNPGDYANIYQAHTAASAGDTIYFRPGVHAHGTTYFSITKPVHLVGAGANHSTLTFRLILSGPSMGNADVSVCGLKLRGVQGTGSAFLVSRCEGRVHLQDLHVDPNGFIPLGSAPTYATYIDRSDDVVATNCVFEGRDGQSTTDEGANAGHALYVNQGKVVLYGTRVLGGEGGIQTQSHYAANGPGDGGYGLTIWASLVEHAGCAFLGGAAGYDYWATGSPGYDVATYSGGGHLAMTHDRFFFDLPSLAQEGATQELKAYGPVGTQVYALSSTLGHFRHLGPNFGILHLGGSLDVTFLGQIPAGGQLSVPFAAPSLGGGAEALQRLQLFASGAGHRMISDPRVRTIVPPGL